MTACPKCGVKVAPPNLADVRNDTRKVLVRSLSVGEHAPRYLAQSFLLASVRLLGYCANHAVEIAAATLSAASPDCVRETETALVAANNERHLCVVIPLRPRAVTP